MKRTVLWAIRLYQNKPFLAPGSCRFRPTCSQYAYRAVARYGAIKGLILGMRRILRCHPWGQAGYDPVPRGSS